jgi:hypothetical protein
VLDLEARGNNIVARHLFRHLVTEKIHLKREIVSEAKIMDVNRIALRDTRDHLFDDLGSGQ